jgi:hypothetical protein
MKTDNLISMLAAGAGPAPSLRSMSSFAPVLAFGLIASVALSLGARGLVPASMWGGAALWTKLAYAAALAGGCAWLAARLARPGAPRRDPALAVAGVILVMGLAGLVALAGVAPSERLHAILGSTALVCPWAIPVLALPTLAGLLWTLRDFAPTRPGLTGLVAGLLAGGVGAAGYALSCTEQSTTFIALWYSAGMAVSGGLGAVIGGRTLRW